MGWNSADCTIPGTVVSGGISQFIARIFTSRKRTAFVVVDVLRTNRKLSRKSQIERQVLAAVTGHQVPLPPASPNSPPATPSRLGVAISRQRINTTAKYLGYQENGKPGACLPFLVCPRGKICWSIT